MNTSKFLLLPMLFYIFLSIRNSQAIYTVLSVTSQNSIFCDLIASTDIVNNYGFNYSCINGSPVSSICNGVWSSNGYVNCSQYEEITSINFSGLIVTGTIPKTLGSLTSLTKLDLSLSGFYGTIPTSFGNLESMENLFLSYNCLSGTLPSEIGSMSSLAFVTILSNMITGTLPSSMGYLKNLKDFRLGYNSLTGSLPTSLSQLSSLTFLGLPKNSFTGTIPSNLSKLTKLHRLILASNNFTGNIPKSFCNLISLGVLNLNLNSLNGSIPSCLGDLRLIALLDLSYNSITGTIPAYLLEKTFMLLLNLEHNQLTGTLPTTIANQMLLHSLYLSYNKISGTVPSYFARLFINTLELDNNKLTGTIPEGVVTSDLIILNVAHNNFHGSVPASFCDTNVQQVHFNANPNLGCFYKCLSASASVINGVVGICEESSIICNLVESTNAESVLSGWSCDKNIPSTSICDGSWEGIICSVFNILESLSISSSSLNGTLPTSLGLFTYLSYLDFNNNNLFGSIPSTLDVYDSLAYLDLSKNSLTNSIPQNFTHKTNFYYLNLQSNQLSGTIPSGLASKSLTMLDLSNNQLTGSVPSELCGNYLRSFTFNNNTHLGCYASCISTIINVDVGELTACDVSSNLCDLVAATNIESKLSGWSCITGGVPSTSICGGYWKGVKCQGKSVVSLSLTSLSISGTIPTTLGSLTALTYLDLSYNSLYSKIPTSLGDLTGLTSLSLHYNNLNNTLPTSICKLTSLSKLVLNNNKLIHGISDCFVTLLNLKILSLQFNQFQYTIPSQLSKLINLQSLQLQSNNFIGTIPSSILGASLSLLDISDNLLTGSIPTTLCNSITLNSLNLANNSNLMCYPQCLTAITTFVYGTVAPCSFTSSSESSALSVENQIIIGVCTSFAGILLAIFIYYIIDQRNKRVVTVSKRASRMVSHVIIDEHIVEVLEPDRKIHKGTLVMKHSEEIIPTDVIITKYDKQRRRENQILFELYNLNPNIFAKPYGIVARKKMRYLNISDIQKLSSRENHNNNDNNDSYVDDMDIYSHYKNTSFINDPILTAYNFGIGSIILEPHKDCYQSYLSDTTHFYTIYAATNTTQQQQFASFAETVFYKRGLAADTIIQAITSALRHNYVLCHLSPSQLFIYNNQTIKLIDTDGVKAVGDILTDLEWAKDLNVTDIDLTIRKDIFSYSICPEYVSILSSVKEEDNKTNPLVVTTSLAIWGLGVVLFEIFSGCNLFHQICKYFGDELILESIMKLTQVALDDIIDLHCREQRHYLNRIFLKRLLRIEPNERPSIDDINSNMYINTDNLSVLHFFISKHVPLPVIIELLSDDPDFTCFVDSSGLLPVQFALTEGADAPLIAHLLDIYPEACKQRFPANNSTLLQYALDKNMSDDHIRVLLPYFMPVDKESHESKELSSESHGFGWTNVIGHLHPPDKYVNTIAYILKDYTRHIKLLAACVDELGRTALNIATPKCKEEIIKILYFLGIYDLRPEVAHRSSTCIVRLGTDTRLHINVALKFMKMKDQFLREIKVRERGNFSDEYVLGYLQSMDSDTDEWLLKELVEKGFGDYKYVLVMIEAERTLQDIIAHEHIAGKDWDKIRGICTQLTQAVKHVHSTGLIHGDIKPLNVMRVRGRMILIDFDACVSYKDGQHAGAKYSSAYIPPEMVHIENTDEDDDNGHTAMVKCPLSHGALRENVPELPYAQLVAQPSYDIWALGVTFYHMCTGKPLFVIDVDDNIDDAALVGLHDWNNSYKDGFLSAVANPLARNLLSQLLNKNPERRPSAERVLDHPFLSGKSAARLPGQVPEYDVFISYRVGADAHHAERLYNILCTKEIKVWWDKVCLEDGKPWEEGFCNGLAKSMAFIPILSREAINSDIVPSRQNFSELASDSPCDNVFLEHRLALEMRAMGLIELIYPVMIGDQVEGDEVEGSELKGYTNYFASECHPKTNPITVLSVEEKVIEHLDRQGLGAPLGTTTTVSGVLGELLKNQGGFVEGKEDTAFEAVIEKIVKMVHQHRRAYEKVNNKRPLKPLVSQETMELVSPVQSSQHLVHQENNLITTVEKEGLSEEDKETIIKILKEEIVNLKLKNETLTTQLARVDDTHGYA